MVFRLPTNHIRGASRWLLAAVVVVLITALLLSGCKSGSNTGGGESGSSTYQLTLFEVTVIDSQYEDAWHRLGEQFDIDYESDLSACTMVISPDIVKISGPSLDSDRNTSETLADQKDQELDLPGYVELSGGVVKGRRVAASSNNVTSQWRDLEAQFDKNKITGTFIVRERSYDGNNYVEIDLVSVTFEGIRVD